MESVARGDAAGKLELADRAIGAVADRLLEAVLLGIEAQKGPPTRLEGVGLGATLDAPQHEAEANVWGREGQAAFFARSGKFRSENLA